jgi:phospholipid/cholesterol/gamma-HCH transport system substrate-binding protein
VNSKEGKRLIASGAAILPDREDSINNIVGQVNTLLSLLSDAVIGTDQSSFGRTFMNIEGATRGIVDLTGSIPDNFGESLNEILGRLDTILTEINQVAIRISDPENSIMSILDSQGPVYQDLTATLGSVTASMRNLERTTDYVPAQLPQLTVILTDLHSALKRAEDVLVALTNNPLLKGGVPVRTESSPGGASPRDLDF